VGESPGATYARAIAALESPLSLTADSEAMTIYRYRRELARPIAETPVYPYVLRTFRSRADVALMHALLKEAYAARGASLGSCDEWWHLLCTDPEFDARLVFLVETPIGAVVGAGIAWNSGFIRDLAVAPGHQRLGLGTALLNNICRAFHGRGGHAVELKVEADNGAAIALYESMGMQREETVN
jgi:ribosomal protein S18 acetylase RimI-like enzyme